MMLDWLNLLHFEARTDTSDGAEFWCSDAEHRECSTDRAAVCIKVAIVANYHTFKHKCTDSQPLAQPPGVYLQHGAEDGSGDK